MIGEPVKALVVFLFALILSGCNSDPPPPPPPVPQDKPAKPLILIDSGLGQPQLREVADMVRREFPDTNVVDFQTGVDAFLANTLEYVKSNPRKGGIIFIGHSYGVSNGFANFSADSSDAIPVRLFIDIDGARYPKHGRFIVTPNIELCVVITGDFSGIIREPINGPYLHFMVHGGHNAMTKEPETLELVRLFVKGSLQ